MSTIRIKCLSCGKTLEADEAWIGTELPCPNCKANILIQKEEPKPQLRVVDEEEDEKEDTASIDFNAVPKDIEEATVFLCEALKANAPLERIIELVETYHADAQNNLCYVQSPVVLSYLLAHGAGTLLGEEDCKSLINSYIREVRYLTDVVHYAWEINQCTSLLEILLKLPQCKKTWIQESLIGFYCPVDFPLMSWFINTYAGVFTKEESILLGGFIRRALTATNCCLERIEQILALPHLELWAPYALGVDEYGRDIWFDFHIDIEYAKKDSQRDDLIAKYEIIGSFLKEVKVTHKENAWWCWPTYDYDCVGTPKVSFRSYLLSSAQRQACKVSGYRIKNQILTRFPPGDCVLTICFLIFAWYTPGTLIGGVVFIFAICFPIVNYVRRPALKSLVRDAQKHTISIYGYWKPYPYNRKRTDITNDYF